MPEALRLDFNLGDGLDIAGGDDRARHIAARDFGDLVGVDGVAFGEAHEPDHCSDTKGGDDTTEIIQMLFILTRCGHVGLP